MGLALNNHQPPTLTFVHTSLGVLFSEGTDQPFGPDNVRDGIKSLGAA